MTFEEAQDYAIQYGKRAKALVRKTKRELAMLEERLLAAAGTMRIHGVMSKDELIASILAMEFPLIREADHVRFEHERTVNP